MSELHIIFGTGPLGMSVMRELVKGRKQVKMVNRNGKADVPAGVTVLASDAYDAARTREICKGASVVYQCAQPAYYEWVEKFPALQAAILEGAAANGAKFIVGDNLYMYGDTDGKPIHEKLPYAAHTRKGKTRARMAQAVTEAHQSGKVRAAIARGADFYGPGVLGSTLGEQVFAPLVKGKTAQATGSLDLPHTYTFIDDFGKAMVILGEREEALGDIWHVPNPPTMTQRQLITLAFNIAGIPPRMRGMGRLMMRIGGMFIPEARETVEMMYEFEKPFVVDHSKFERVFGNHATPHETGLRQTVEWYKKHLTN